MYLPPADLEARTQLLEAEWELNLLVPELGNLRRRVLDDAQSLKLSIHC